MEAPDRGWTGIVGRSWQLLDSSKNVSLAIFLHTKSGFEPRYHSGLISVQRTLGTTTYPASAVSTNPPQWSSGRRGAALLSIWGPPSTYTSMNGHSCQQPRKLLADKQMGLHMNKITWLWKSKLLFGSIFVKCSEQFGFRGKMTNKHVCRPMCRLIEHGVFQSGPSYFF